MWPLVRRNNILMDRHGKRASAHTARCWCPIWCDPCQLSVPCRTPKRYQSSASVINHFSKSYPPFSDRSYYTEHTYTIVRRWPTHMCIQYHIILYLIERILKLFFFFFTNDKKFWEIRFLLATVFGNAPLLRV